MSRIENLGDYNTARIMLKEKNGDLSALINEFKEIGALEALPKQIRTGILIGAPIGGAGVFAAIKVSDYIKKRKQAKLKEVELKAELEKALELEEVPTEPEKNKIGCKGGVIGDSKRMPCHWRL